MESSVQPATRIRLFALLAIALLLRLVLAMKGGQDFWPDESRYFEAVRSVEFVADGNFRAASDLLFGKFDHALFRFVALPVAIVEHFIGHRPPLAAWYFGSFSVLSIYLVWRLARRTGAGETEALWAAFLAASANSLFYYSRHHFPYDAALAAVLASLLVGLGPSSRRRSFLTGLLAGIAFLVYNGYWLAGAAVLGVHVLFGDGGRGRGLSRLALSAAGLASPIIAMCAISAVLGYHPLDGYLGNSGTISQGDFGSGYLLIPEYFWWSERLVAVVWVAAGAYALFGVATGERSRRILIWAWCLGCIAVGLVFFSDVVPKFVVYGRLARTLAPFCCLLAAAGVTRWVSSRGQGFLNPALAGLVGIAALGNIAGPFAQVFPADFSARGREAIALKNTPGMGVYSTLFAHEVLSEAEIGAEPPPAEVVLRLLHPLGYFPYQYEGATAAMRSRLRSRDISMRVLRLRESTTQVSDEWGGYPGPVRMTVTFPTDRQGLAEPLLTSGMTGRHDFLFVRYVDPGHVAFGLDHVGADGVLSEPIAVDYAKSHSIEIVEGALFPPVDNGIYRASPDLAHLRGRILVILDGAVALSAHSAFHPARPSQLQLGVNLFGGNTTTGNFTGTMTDVEPLSRKDLEGRVPELMAEGLGRMRPPDWSGAVGPFRLKFTLPPAGPEGHPLASVATSSSGDLVFLLRESPGRIRIGLDRLGKGAVISDEIAVGPGPVQAEISMGSLLPRDDAVVFGAMPAVRNLRDMFVLRVNDKTVLSASLAFDPAATVVFGANTVGSSISRPYFEGEIVGVELIEPGRIDAGMRLDERLAPHADEAAGGYVGPLHLRVEFPAGVPGTTEPIVVSGVTGAADFVYVQYEEARKLRIGFDHWGSASPVSESFDYEPGKAYDLVVSLGSWYPPAGNPYYAGSESLSRLRTLLYVSLDEKEAFNLLSSFHPATRGQVTLGRNLVGGSTTGAVFLGRIRGVSREAPQRITARNMGSLGVEREGWGGYSGPVLLKVQFPRNPIVGPGEPLLTTGATGAGDFLFVQYLGNDMARIGFDHWGTPASISAPFRLNGEATHTIIATMGSLFPSPESPVVSGDAAMRTLTGRMIAQVDGNRLIDVEKPFFPARLDQIVVGVNFIGGSSAGRTFSGKLQSVELAPIPPLMR